MTEQSNALLLADEIDGNAFESVAAICAAAELRRLYAQRDALLKACHTLVGLLDTEDWQETLRLAVQQAREAINTVEENK